ncbi:MAG: ankyrin repeat domain-containing protein [Burkholderiales bacterium]
MADSSTITEHLIQAALRYLERGDVKSLRAVLQEHPATARMRGMADGRGVIHAAAEVGRVDMLSVLLDAGADPNMPEGERIDDENGFVYQPGYAPLHYAAREGHAEAVNLLLTRGAMATATDHTGGTPLHAVQKVQIAEALLKAGADPNADCCMRYFDEILGWHFAGRPLHGAAQCGNVELIRALVDHCAMVDGTDHITARTALHYAAARGRTEAVEVLLQCGANLDAMSDEAGYAESYHMTPLHYAAREGHKEVVRLLLKAGANAGLKGGWERETARKIAAEAGHHGIAAMLAAATSIARVTTTTESIGENGQHTLKGASAAEKAQGELFGFRDKSELGTGPTFDKDTHAEEKPDLSVRDAERIKNDIVKLCVDDLEAMTDGLQSGDDSGLENIWEEICVQVQGEESVFFSMYENLIDSCVKTQVKNLTPDEKFVLWLTTDEGLDWVFDNQDDEGGARQVRIRDVEIADIVSEIRPCVLSEAADYENDRIDRCKWNLGQDDDEVEDEEDEDGVEDEHASNENDDDGKAPKNKGLN